MRGANNPGAEPNAGVSHPHALTRLADLCARLGVEPEPAADIDSLLDALTDPLDRVLTEHRGMADELIAAYEQLGAVFEVTRSLPNLHSESQVVTLFVETMRGSFGGRNVNAVRLARDSTWRMPKTLRPAAAWLSGMFDRAVLGGSAIVEHPPSGLTRCGMGEALVGPVLSGDRLVCVIIITRPASSPAFRAVDMMLVDSLATFCGDLIRNMRLLAEVRSLSVAVVRALVSAVDQKDEYTCGHSLRVAFFACQLGKRVGLPKNERQMLQWAALLHDVGKIGIRDSVLKKTGKLTDEEFAHIKEHPTRSHKVVQGIPQLAGALGGILHHHERFDGCGYPQGLAGEAIPLQARIIQIADMFDALTSDRAYRTAYSWEKALAILAGESGTAIDPALQVVFEKMIRDELSTDPDAWDRMIDRANRFTETAAGETLGEQGF